MGTVEDMDRWRILSHSRTSGFDEPHVRFVSQKSTGARKQRRRGGITAFSSYGINAASPRPLGKILDKLARDQKRDTLALQSGYLSHDRMNKTFTEATHPQSMDHTKCWKQHADIQRKLEIDRRRKAHLEERGIPDDIKVPKVVQEARDEERDVADEHEGDKAEVGTLDDSPADENSGAYLMSLLDKYDSLKTQSRSTPLTDPTQSKADDASSPHLRAFELPELSCAHGYREFAPTYLYNTTMSDQYRAFKQVDSSLVEREWKQKTSSDNIIQSLQYTLETELAALDPEQRESPSLSRLAVFSDCFDKLIASFHVYGPLLSRIKREYDGTIGHFKSESDELNFLRAKVRKLLAQNENRLLLKHEKKKSKCLEKEIVKLEETNEKMKSEVQRKLAMYSSYVPLSVLNEKTDGLASGNIDLIRNAAACAPGQDPISVFEERIDGLESELSKKAAEIAELIRQRDEEFVPLSLKSGLETVLADAQLRLAEAVDKNRDIKEKLTFQEKEIERLGNLYKDKEKQYVYLLTEFHELSEKTATKYDDIEGPGNTATEVEKSEEIGDALDRKNDE